MCVCVLTWTGPFCCSGLADSHLCVVVRTSYSQRTLRKLTLIGHGLETDAHDIRFLLVEVVLFLLLLPLFFLQSLNNSFMFKAEQAGRLRNKSKASGDRLPRVSDARSLRESDQSSGDYRSWESPSWKKSVRVCVYCDGWCYVVQTRGPDQDEVRFSRVRGLRRLVREEIDTLRHFEIGSTVPCKSFPNATHTHTPECNRTRPAYVLLSMV